jgi:tetratricopeptide (TPR) repeat protein
MVSSEMGNRTIRGRVLITMTSAIRSLLALLVVAGAVSAASLDEGVERYFAMDYVAAERHLQAVSDAEPENARAFAYLGLALAGRNQPSEAQTAIDRACGLAPESDEVLAARGIVRVLRRQYDPAASDLNKAREIRSDSELAVFGLGMLHTERKQHQQAVDALEKAIEMNPENALAYYYAGIAYNGLRRSDKMVEKFQTFLRLAPRTPEAQKVQSLLRAVR